MIEQEEDHTEQLLKEIIAGPRQPLPDPESIQGLISGLMKKYPGEFAPTEEEWKMIYEANEGLTKAINANEERRAILDRLERLWDLRPDMTLGKLILSVVEPAALYTLGDGPLLSALEVCLAQDSEL